MRPNVRYLIVGCGYVGRRLARSLSNRISVTGITSSRRSASGLDRHGVDGCAWNLDEPDAPAPRILNTLTQTVFYFAPPPPAGSTDPRLAYFLKSLTEYPNRLIYLSTTGVYGDAAGALVDEDSTLAPTSERAQRRVDAEQQIQAWANERNVAWTILRVPAIYGPGRLPIERIKRAEPMIRHSEAPPASRIHVDDLIAACLLANETPRAKNRIYNVTDGNSTSMTEYFERVATLTGLPTPTLISREEAATTLSPELWSFLQDSRRIDSQRIRQELGFAPRFTDLRLGILSSLPAPEHR